MYCRTYANNSYCIVNELLLWTEISSEHPIFIKTIAALTKKKLSTSTLNKLMDIHKMFSDLNKMAYSIKDEQLSKPCHQYTVMSKIQGLVNKFLLHDTHMITLLPEMQDYGKDDEVWQTLLQHIDHEQRFMYELFTDLQKQFE